MNYSIRTRLGLGILPMLLLLIGMGVFSVWLQRGFEASVRVFEEQSEKSQRISKLQLLITNAVMPTNDYIITGDKFYRAQFEKVKEETLAFYGEVIGNQLFSVEEEAGLQESRDMFEGVVRLSERILSTQPGDPGLPDLMEEMDYQYARPAVSAVEQFRQGIQATQARARADIERNKAYSHNVFGIVFLASILSGVLAGLLQTRAITGPIRRMMEALRSVSEGDLTKRMDVSSMDEFGQVARAFNEMAENMSGMVVGILETSRELHNLSNSVSEASSGISRATGRQAEAASRVSAAAGEASSGFSSASGDAKKLEGFIRGVRESSNGIRNALADLQSHIENLGNSTDMTGSSVQRLKESFAWIVSEVDTLSEETENVAAAVTQIGQGIKEVARHSGEQANLSKTMRDELSRVGLAALEETLRSVERMKLETEQTAHVVGSLDGMSQEIGKVIGVINDITEATRLLSLNAAILAAQAGEHGRSFSVVADEIDELATSTAASTRDIRDLVRRIQEELSLAVGCTNRTRKAVEATLSLSSEAQGVLGKVVEATEYSLDMATRVDAAVNEQKSGVDTIVGNVQKISEKVEGIRTATNVQEGAIEQIGQEVETVRHVARDLWEASKGQTRDSRALDDAIGDASSRMEAVSDVVEEQERVSREIAGAMKTIKDEVDTTDGRAKSLMEMVETLRTNGTLLKNRVERFRTE